MSRIVGCEASVLCAAEDQLLKSGLAKFQRYATTPGIEFYTLCAIDEIPDLQRRGFEEIMKFADANKIEASAGESAVPVSVAETFAPPEMNPESAKLKEPVREVKLSDKSRNWFRKSAANMSLYLRFGAAAYGAETPEQIAALTSTPMDWLKHNPVDLVNPLDRENGWTVQQFAGYYWAGVCQWREANKVPVTFPRMSRLFGEMKNFMNLAGADNAYKHIWRLVRFFDFLRYLVGKIGQDMTLNETSFNHMLLQQASTRIESRGMEWANMQAQRMAAGKPPLRDGETDGGENESFYANSSEGGE